MVDDTLTREDVVQLVGSLRSSMTQHAEVDYHVYRVLDDLRNLLLHDLARQRQQEHPNPLRAFGQQCFSQADEDGITMEILRRMDLLASGTYLELGVGNGIENNTLVLAALGWSGAWIGDETLAFETARTDLVRFSFQHAWITLENLPSLLNRARDRLACEQFDVVSIDLDGNDLHVARSMLEQGFRPRLWVVEYNSQFPPPIRFSISYDPEHRWQQDNYFGASLASFVDLFSDFRYRLVCCNAQMGSNAFFVPGACGDHFTDIPTELEILWVAPRLHVRSKATHKTPARSSEAILGDRLEST